MQLLSCVRNLGDPGKVKGMFKSKSSVTARLDSFFSWKSDDFIVVLKQSNFCGAKEITKFGPQTLNSSEDYEPELKGNQ